ncbi:alpha/beta hydrolase [Saccharopolyspora rosea]|uniref:Alpha/beta hydrolase n=1 Tax=Saccharopolyspora rosea TaxID=524884 RepID=A0ABW3FU76_9PSEU|nr:alpha/beta hydrolase [Saccharopolyspora rosea]
MLDDEVTQVLRELDAGFPPVHEMTGPQARRAVAARRAPAANLDDVAVVEDRRIPAEDRTIGVRLYRPHGDRAARPVVVFLHGGGFVCCDLDSHDGFCRALAKGTDALVVSVDYRLAPEHPAPAAALDAHAAVRWAAEHAAGLGGDPARIAVAGDSAGGNLAAVAALLSRERGPRLAAQVLLYPVVDPGCDTGSYRTYGTGHYNTEAAMRWYWRQYLGGDALPDPAHLVAPLRAPRHDGLPPAVVVTAQRDPLCDEAAAYARTLTGAGVPVVHRHYPGLFHGFLTLPGFGPAESARQLLWHDLDRLLSTRSAA